MDDIDGIVLNQGAEPFFQAKQAFAGVDGRDGRFLNLLVGAPVPGGVSGAQGSHLEQILGPSQFILLEETGVADGVVHVEGAKVVRGQGLVPADGVAHRLDVLAVHLESLGGGHAAGVEPARPVGYHAWPDVHLEKGKPRLLAFHHALGVNLGAGTLRGVAVAANAVAILGTDQPPDRYAIDLACDVVQSDIQGAVTAAEPPLVGEIADAIQNGFDIQRVLAQDVRFENQRHALISCIANLAQTIDALVGVDPDDRIVVVGGDPDRPHICNPQLAGSGIPVDAPGL